VAEFLNHDSIPDLDTSRLLSCKWIQIISNYQLGSRLRDSEQSPIQRCKRRRGRTPFNNSDALSRAQTALVHGSGLIHLLVKVFIAEQDASASKYGQPEGQSNHTYFSEVMLTYESCIT
jgi:hypothetical protein